MFDSNTILDLPRMPTTMIVLGAGVIGVEFASIFAALGIEVTLVDTRDRLLPYLDREIVEILEREIARLGITDPPRRPARVRSSGSPATRPACAARSGTPGRSRPTCCSTASAATATPAASGSKLLGLVPNDYGLLAVNEHYQTAVPHIYAVGDVIGYPALASTSMEQGRQAMRHAFEIPGLTQKTETLPFAIYAIPEVSYVGETEEIARRTRASTYLVGRGNYDMNPRGQIIGDTEGMLKLLFEAPSMRLVGAHMIGHGASELIHIGQAFLRAGATAYADRRDAVQLPDALRPLPARGAKGAARGPARQLGRGRRAAL